MTELSETQRLVLTTAIERKDRCIYPTTAGLKGGAAGNVARSLLKRGLVEEVQAGKNTVWRHGADGTAVTLRATKLALRVFGRSGGAAHQTRGRYLSGGSGCRSQHTKSN